MGIKLEIENQFEIGDWIVPKGRPDFLVDQDKLLVEGMTIDIGFDGYINWLYSLVSSAKVQRIYFQTAHRVYRKITSEAK